MRDAPDDPSPPRRSLAGGSATRFDVVASAQTLGALLLGILLFAVPLYLWRRPRAVPAPPRVDAAVADLGARDGAPVAVSGADAGRPPPVKLADARVLECHDRGSRRTAAADCDHIPAFEKAFADAIEAAHDCVPSDAGAGSLEFVADLSFGRKRNPVTLQLPRDGRSFSSARIARDCVAAVRSRLATLPVASFTHAHSRYKVALVASYGPQSSP